MDLERFTAAQLGTLHRRACTAAQQHYQAAQAITRTSAEIPLDAVEIMSDNMAAWSAAMAAGNEQYELAKSITAEITRRMTSA